MALVTGAARRVGRTIALTLAAAGFDLVLHYHRSASEAARTAADAEALGVRATHHAADLQASSELQGLVDQAFQDFGRLDHLVSSASTLQKRSVLKLAPAEWDAAMGANLGGPLVLAQAAARRMVRAVPEDHERSPDSPSITFILDGSALAPWPGYTAHGTARAALAYLTRALALEWAPGIRVNAVVAGPVLPPDDMPAASEVWQRILRSVPLGDRGRPEDVAEAVRFLVQSPYITGVILPVDGGQHLKGSPDG